MNKTLLKNKIAAAGAKIPADLVIKNGKIIDVFNQEIIAGDLAIKDGLFVGIGDYEGIEIIDAGNRYICPGFIDAHVHIESSMVTPTEFAKAVLPHGVTTVIADPHEIANVSGIQGIQFMLDNSENLPLDVKIMLPSCVPATPFENNGAELLAEELKDFYQHERVLGLAEVMDYPSLQNADDHIMDKILQTNEHKRPIDGHLAGLDETAINIYRTAGIRTDHECTTATEALDRIRRGMYVMIREGSAAKNLTALIPAVNQHNARRFMFCTDDKHLDEIVEEGSIDHHVRMAIREGLSPLLAIQIGSLNAAECYGLHQKGAIAPGYKADFLLLDDLEAVNISEVYVSGKLTARNGIYAGDSLQAYDPEETLTKTVHIPEILEKDFQIPIGETISANVIGIIPNSIVTKKLEEKVQVIDGNFVPSLEKDQLKLAVLERHKNTGNIGLGIVKGFGFTNGAIATTIAHDSHNIVAVGANDRDLLAAIREIKELNGGCVVIKDGKVIAALSLPIGGLMSEKSFMSIHQELKKINEALVQIGFNGNFNPFLTLSFLTLPVIPELKLTDLGLFDVGTFQHIEVSQ
ncbi:adenine deaminase [Bacillus sp. MUM 116]|uniref:adenine deaminase n=1 Tax=Bacillus sp. MUM 116 TaxID=1678002 RepID=UPI0008F59F5E|nr:adenine deaminase [Bacillus sp. MUM 116]OIK09157.1 adenine deaminase [Bacillus sp. MUM 116]